jgi:hypothetical protein
MKNITGTYLATEKYKSCLSWNYETHKSSLSFNYGKWKGKIVPALN